jgi:prevent-host-death family protein
VRSITQRELRNESGEIMRAVEAGETFVVTRNGVPAAELRPLRRRVVVRRDDAVAGAARLPALDYATFRRDVDAPLDQTPDRG